MSNCYIRLFSERNVQKTSFHNCVFSYFFPEEVRNVLINKIYNKIIPQDRYILCPLYKKGDIQIGVSGTTKVRQLNNNSCLLPEHREITASRELGEELGLYPDIGLFDKSIYIRDVHYEKTDVISRFSILTTSLDRCRYLTEKEEGISANLYKDFSYKKGSTKIIPKVYCFVYGSFGQIADYLREEEIARFKDSHSDIIGVAAIPITELIKNV